MFPAKKALKIVIAVCMLGAFFACHPVLSQQKDVDINEKEEFDFANGLFSRGMYDMAIEGYSKFLKT